MRVLLFILLGWVPQAALSDPSCAMLLTIQHPYIYNHALKPRLIEKLKLTSPLFKDLYHVDFEAPEVVIPLKHRNEDQTGSIHYVAKHVAGSHLLMTFHSESQRESFAEANKSSIVLRELSHDNSPAMLLRADLMAYLGPQSEQALKQISISLTEIRSRSNSSFQTKNGTTYFFRDREPIGYARGQQAWEFVKDERGVNWASHEAIRRRQSGSEVQKPKTGSEDQAFLQDFERVRKRWLKVDKNLIPNPAYGLGDASRRILNARTHTELQEAVDPWLKARQQLFEQSEVRASGIRWADLSWGLSSLRDVAAPDTTVNLWFIWFKGIDPRRGFLFTPHYQHDDLVWLALGKDVRNRTLVGPKQQALAGILRGGVLSLRFDSQGRLSRIDFPEAFRQMEIPGHNYLEGKAIRMSDEEATQLLGLVRLHMGSPNP